MVDISLHPMHTVIELKMWFYHTLDILTPSCMDYEASLRPPSNWLYLQLELTSLIPLVGSPVENPPSCEAPPQPTIYHIYQKSYNQQYGI